MKKIFLCFLVAIQSYCYAQGGSAITVPTSVSVLGEEYSNMFKEQAGILGQIEKKLAEKKDKFPTINSLVSYSCSEWSRLSGITCRIDETSVSSYLAGIGQGGENYETCVSRMTVSDDLKKIFININAAIRNFETETDLNSVLYSYSSDLSAYNLQEGDKERLKMYIVSLNFGQYVLMNSTPVRNIISLHGNGPFTERTIWGWIKAALRCGLGTVGGALLGGLGGAAAGTLSLPVVGTVSGAAIGLWGGAMTGASQSCF